MAEGNKRRKREARESNSKILHRKINGIDEVPNDIWRKRYQIFTNKFHIKAIEIPEEIMIGKFTKLFSKLQRMNWPSINIETRDIKQTTLNEFNTAIGEKSSGN